MTTMRQGEIVTGLALAGLGLFIVAKSSQWVLLAKDGPGPGFFPLIYGLLMVVLSLALVTQALPKRPVAAAAEDKGNTSVTAALSVWLAFTATILIMKAIGFMVALGLLVFFMTRVIFSKPHKFSVLSALLVPLGFYVIFKLGLQVQLPVGTWTGI